jgi:hypothetical protein
MNGKFMKLIVAGCVASLFGASAALAYMKDRPQDRWELETRLMYGQKIPSLPTTAIVQSEESDAVTETANPAKPAKLHFFGGYDQSMNKDIHTSFNQQPGPYGQAARSEGDKVAKADQGEGGVK